MRTTAGRGDDGANDARGLAEATSPRRGAHGDGFTTQYTAQIGLPLTSRGYATLTAEWRNADATSRSVQRDDAAAAIAESWL